MTNHRCDCLGYRALERQVRDLQRALDEERRRFPADGVWLVTTEPGARAQARIAKLGEVPDPMPLAAIARHTDAIAAAILEVREQAWARRSTTEGTQWWHSPSAREYAEAIVRRLAEAGDA